MRYIPLLLFFSSQCSLSPTVENLWSQIEGVDYKYFLRITVIYMFSVFLFLFAIGQTWNYVLWKGELSLKSIRTDSTRYN